MILLNDFKRQWEQTRTKFLEAVTCVGESGWYVLGVEVSSFEKDLAKYWGLRRTVGVASGLDAIEIGLKVLGCRTGSKVLTTPISAFATSLAILKLGAIPVFVDSDDYGLIDLQLCRSVLAANEDIRFLLPVHLYGHAIDPVKLDELRCDFQLNIVEDCAQSIGSSFKGRATATAGQIAATSFYPTKNLGCMGDGGAILTDHDQFAEQAARFRNYGEMSKYRHELTGYNSRLDELQASIMRRVYLPLLDEWIQSRRQIAQRYIEGIKNPLIMVLGAPPHSDSNWHLFPILVPTDEKPAFARHMKGRGIMVGEHYPVIIPDQPALRERDHVVASELRHAKRIAECEVSLPIHPYLTGDEVDRVIEACNDWRQ